MARLTMKSVVVSLAFFPICLLGGAWAHLAQKKPRAGGNSCNITRGYVARIPGGGGQIPRAFFQTLILSDSENLTSIIKNTGLDGYGQHLR